jgi:hypothetical protein
VMAAGPVLELALALGLCALSVLGFSGRLR